jgi:phosphatidylinositol alpha-1,6-mannosyltransferase
MKVLYLVPQPKQGDRLGAYTFLDEEIEALGAAGIHAYVLSTAAPADRERRNVQIRSEAARRSVATEFGAASLLLRRLGAVPRGNVWHPLNLYRPARAEHLAAAIVKEEGIDLIHSHFAWPRGYGGLLARAETGRPLIATLRGTDILLDSTIGYGRRSDPCFDRAVRRLVRIADRTVYFSNYMRDRGVALGARPEAARVIRKGVDLTHFTVADDRLALRRNLGLAARPMILTVAGLIERKGVHHILNALAHLRDDVDFTFVVCGDGPDRARLEALAAQLKLHDRVVFAGRVDRQTIPKYFAACDVFVLASVVEAAGNVLFEAMSSGRPVVCTDSGGPGEYVAEGQTGFVVPVGDPAAMARRIRQLLDDPALQDRLGGEGRRRTVREFDYGRMVSDLIAVYEETLKSPSVLQEGYRLGRSRVRGLRERT